MAAGLACSSGHGEQLCDSGCVLKVEPQDLLRWGQGLDEGEKDGGVLCFFFLFASISRWVDGVAIE